MRNGRVNRLIGETGKIVMSVNRIKTIIETFLGSDMPGEVQQRFAEWLRDPASRDEKERALENYWNGLRAEEPGGRERKLERLHEAMRRGERFRVRRIWRNVAAAAAVVLLAAGTNYVTCARRSKPTSSPRPPTRASTYCPTVRISGSTPGACSGTTAT